MVVVFDTTFLLLLFNPATDPATDADGNPIPRCRERVEYLAQKLNDSKTLICVPTPALSELMVKAGKAGPGYLKELAKTSRFKISPFDTRAALDASDLIGKILKEQKHRDDGDRAKVKFDTQIVAIAKAQGAKAIFSDDKGVKNKALRFGITTFKVADLDAPPEAAEESATDTQLSLTSEEPEKVETDSDATKREPSAAHTVEVRGGREGVPRSEAAQEEG